VSTTGSRVAKKPGKKTALVKDTRAGLLVG
jgi:hypothetical protein